MVNVAGSVNGDVDQDLILPPIPPDVKPQVLISSNIMTSGTRRISLLANHFQDTVKPPDIVLYKYIVSITSEDKRAVEDKGIGRKLIAILYEKYSSELANTKFKYDGKKALYTVGPLPRNKLEFTVVLKKTSANSENGSPSEGTEIRSGRSPQSKTFTVELSYAAKIPLKFEPLANMGCPFFHDESRIFADVGAGIIGVQRFHSSFHPTQGGLSLSTDVSRPLIMTPGPDIDFLIANQGVQEPYFIDWIKAKEMWENMRINMESNMIGISDKPCNLQCLPMKSKTGDGTSEGELVVITVDGNFSEHYGIEHPYSADLPRLDVSKPLENLELPEARPKKVSQLIDGYFVLFFPTVIVLAEILEFCFSLPTSFGFSVFASTFTFLSFFFSFFDNYRKLWVNLIKLCMMAFVQFYEFCLEEDEELTIGLDKILHFICLVKLVCSLLIYFVEVSECFGWGSSKVVGFFLKIITNQNVIILCSVLVAMYALYLGLPVQVVKF